MEALHDVIYSQGLSQEGSASFNSSSFPHEGKRKSGGIDNGKRYSTQYPSCTLLEGE